MPADAQRAHAHAHTRTERLPRLSAAVALTGVLIGNLAWGAPIASAQATCAPYASGLNGPRGVAVADDGTVYVAEAGIGGSETFPAPPGGPPAPPDAPRPNRGTSGQISRIAPGGARTVVAGGLPSYANGFEVVGPAGIVLAAGAIWATNGGGAVLAGLQPLPNENSVLRIVPQTGAMTRVADLGAIEVARNPDGLAVDSNLYGLALAGDGNLYVADAGANALYRVRPAGGAPELVTVFPGIPLPPAAAPPGGNPSRGGRNELDPVPTGVAPNPAGGVYVGYLSGGPFPQGAASVVGVATNGQITPVGGGLTAVVGVAVGPDRQVYVSEIFSQFDLSTTPPMPRPGRVRRILPNGSAQVIAEGLSFPNGIAFDRAGNLYISVNSAFTPPGSGQTLRCERVAAPAAGFPSTGTGGAAGAAGMPWLAYGAGGLTLAVAALAGVRAALTPRRPSPPSR